MSNVQLFLNPFGSTPIRFFIVKNICRKKLSLHSILKKGPDETPGSTNLNLERDYEESFLSRKLMCT
jgi:hypothetical protein